MNSYHAELIIDLISEEWHDPLTVQDIWNIIDMLHTHVLDNDGSKELLQMMSGWLEELSQAYPEIEP